MQEYNVYELTTNRFIKTFKTVLSLKQWAYINFCDSDKEEMKNNMDVFSSLKKANQKETLVYLNEWFNCYYKKEDAGTREPTPLFSEAS